MQLYPHNQKAYEKVLELFEITNRVCIIQPTGTGKSLIISKLIQDNPSARHLLLAPGSHILQEIQKHAGERLITFSTYIGVKTNLSLFEPHSFDYIYLDEFHRLGAEVWGGIVQRLLQLNPKAKVLGTSATPIRYLDDFRNMAIEIFNNCIAVQMSLVTAIAEDILPEPIYISALYSIKEELDNIKQKILSSNSKEKEVIVRELDSKVIDWENTSGLDAVVKKYLTAERRKVIVFCKDWSHLRQARQILDPVFNDIFGDVRCLSIYSKLKSKENQECLAEFSKEGTSPVVLYTIDKVNEGLHCRDCNTVILLRGTISPIIFYQQIGRAFSIGCLHRPMIVDLVNNFENVNPAFFRDEFVRERTSVLQNRKSTGQLSEQDKIKKSVMFIDETQDIREILLAFGERVDSWMLFFKRAKHFFEENGHLFVPPSNKELCRWVRLQGSYYRKGFLNKEKVKLLESIQICSAGGYTAIWLTRYHELLQWAKSNGRLPTRSENRLLATWIVKQRQQYVHAKLTMDQIALLRPLVPLGGNRVRMQLEALFERLIEHFRNGDIYSMNERIRRDLTNIRNRYLKNQLLEKDQVYLRKGRVPFEITMNDLEWLGNVKNTIAWCKENGRLPDQKDDSVLYNFWLREEKYIGKSHFYEKFISSNLEAERLVKELQELILEGIKSRRRNSCLKPGRVRNSKNSTQLSE